jgi:hypothetical protein
MAAGSFGAVVTRALRAAVRTGLRELSTRTPTRRRAAPRPPAPSRPRPATAPGRPGAVELDYGPRDDGRPDPGEVVWAWVPYEEGDGRGKDRPVLVIARDGAELVGLMLTSKDHDRDAADEARHGREWFDIGTGAWDRQGRPSEVRLDRLLRLDPDGVRREGGALDRRRYDQVAAQLRRVHGWR